MRPITVKRRFTTTPAGSVLWTQGNTVVLVTASVAPEVPSWFPESRAGGWLTCDYVMLPGSTPRRKDWPEIGHTDSRGTEIQRMIGRSVRAVLDLSKIGPHTIHLDCQVLQADGGTRTACISASYVALVDALKKLPESFPGMARPGRANQMNFSEDPTTVPAVPAKFDKSFYAPGKALTDQLAAVSVGIVGCEIVLDPDYSQDSKASADVNVAYTASGKFAEIQGSAENGEGFDRRMLDRLLERAVEGCKQVFSIQSRALSE